jgi:hypothetical protein
VSIVAKLKTLKRAELASLAFYALSGIILLALLPFAGFPPHVALIGILSLIAAYSLFTNRGWTLWLVAILFFIASVFAFYTLYAAGFSNALLGVGLIVYVALTWVFALYVLFKRKA